MTEMHFTFYYKSQDSFNVMQTGAHTHINVIAVNNIPSRKYNWILTINTMIRASMIANL